MAEAQRPGVRAAGGVVWREGQHGVQVAVVHRPRYDDWSLPKGKLDPGEPALVGALREVLEETGQATVAGRTLGSSRYRVVADGREVPKTVRWWALEATAGEFTPTAEVDELRWLPPAAARRLLTAGRDTEPLELFLAGPARTRTLLLVRHGSAGVRRDALGDDDQRPLDPRGQAQAQALARLLACYRPVRLRAAPLVRCVDTLRVLAQESGLPVELDPVLAARAHDADSARTSTAVRRLLHETGATVLCSQGEVLPWLVRVLAVGGTATLPEPVPSAKGSVWAMSFDDDGCLLDADHVPDPAA